MELPEHPTKEAPRKSKHIPDKIPLELQSFIRTMRTYAIIMVFISIISVYFIPWAVFYIILAAKLKPNELPSRKLVKWAAILTLPLCFGLIPILIDIEFWRMNGRLKRYEEEGAKAFISDKEYLAGEPKRKRRNTIAWVILLSIIVIFVVLIAIAISSSNSNSNTTTYPTSSTPAATISPEIQAAKNNVDSLTAQYDKCSSDLIAREPTVNRYSQYAVDAYNTDLQACENVRLKQNEAVDKYNSLIGQ
jgi:hypothetical protein